MAPSKLCELDIDEPFGSHIYTHFYEEFRKKSKTLYLATWNRQAYAHFQTSICPKLSNLADWV